MMEECSSPEWTFQQLAPLLHPTTVSQVRTSGDRLVSPGAACCTRVRASPSSQERVTACLAWIFVLSQYVERLSAMLGTLLDAEERGRSRTHMGAGVDGGGGVFYRSVDDKLRDYRHHIAEQILTLRCPRCSRVWDTYDGCDALSW